MKDKTLCRRCEILDKNMVAQERFYSRENKILYRKVAEQEMIIEYITDEDKNKSNLKHLVKENVRLESALEDLSNNSKNMSFYKVENKIRRMIYSIKTHTYKLF